MENTKTGQQKTFKTGRLFEFKLKNHQIFSEGDLNSVTDSSLVIDSETIYISDIAAVRKRTGGQTFFRILGVPVMIAGFGLIYVGGQGLLNAMKNNDQEDKKSNSFIVGGGIGMVVLGFVPFSIDNKAYDIGDEWKLKTLTY